MRLSRERVLVTGGAGFVGSQLLRRLAGFVDEMAVIDNLRGGRREYLVGFPDDNRIRLLEVDLRSPDAMRAVIAFSPDVVFHLAALHYVPYCLAHPQETLDVNVLGTYRLLRCLRALPVRSVVLASSAAVYGFASEPLTESSPIAPGDVYGMSKWVTEELLRRFHEHRPDVRCIAGRLFNVFGPRETNPHVLSTLTSIGEDYEVVLGNLWPMRDFVFVEDVVDALSLCIDGPAGLEIFNIGTGRGTSVRALVHTAARVLGLPLSIRQEEARMRARDGHLVADISRISQQLGWRPKYDLEQGLRALFCWQRQEQRREHHSR